MKYKKTITISVIVLAISFILIALFNSTYALFSTDDYAKVPESFSTGLLQIEANSKSDNISLTNALPLSDEEGVLSEPYVFTIRNVGNLNYNFSVKLLSTGDSNNSFLPQYIKVQVDNGDVYKLSELTNGIIKDDITLNVGQSIDVSVRVWLSIETPNTELGKSFNSKIVTDGKAIYTETNYDVMTLSDYISNLYTGDSKKYVTNNNISYTYGTSSNLMKDKLGGTLQYDGGNLRYYGKSPNNYIYFNCDDYTKQSASTCEKWRIIGVFDGKVKIVRDTAIGNYSWDLNSDSSYDNNWHDATINKLLNDGYYNNKDGYVFYNGFTNTTSGSPIQTTIDFVTSGVGIKNDITRGFISESTWYLGGFDSPTVYSNEIYKYEREDRVYSGKTYDTEWIGNIGIMYLSDYGYATDFSLCNQTLDKYNNSNCYTNNWLYDSSYLQWFINPNVAYAVRAFRSNSDGAIGSNAVYLPRNMTPTLYLDDNVMRLTGDGTSNRPYQLSSGEEIKYVETALTSDDLALIGYTEETTEFVIPSTYQGTDGTWYKITEIGEYTFMGSRKLNSVVIPDTVKTIGSHAFDYTGLTTITIPSSVTLIGMYAFWDTKLTEIIFEESNSVLYIGDYGFFESYFLENIYIPEHVILGSYVFSGSSNLKTAQLLGSTGIDVFSECTSLETVILLPGLSVVGEDGPFDNINNLKALYIPRSAIISGGLPDAAFMVTTTSPVDIYYEGTESEFKTLYLDATGDYFGENVTFHYNYVYE